MINIYCESSRSTTHSRVATKYSFSSSSSCRIICGSAEKLSLREEPRNSLTLIFTCHRRDEEEDEEEKVTRGNRVGDKFSQLINSWCCTSPKHLHHGQTGKEMRLRELEERNSTSADLMALNRVELLLLLPLRLCCHLVLTISASNNKQKHGAVNCLPVSCLSTASNCQLNVGN